MPGHARKILCCGLLLLLCVFAPGGDVSAESGTQKRARRARRARPLKSASNLLARGVWGGSHIRLDVTERGEARVEFDCAYGTLAGPVALDSGGRFDVRGTFTRERGGPTLVPEGEADGAAPPGGGSQPVPARYAGRVEGERLILTVTPLDSESPLGTFTLVRGQPPVLVKCL